MHPRNFNNQSNYIYIMDCGNLLLIVTIIIVIKQFYYSVDGYILTEEVIK